MQPSTLHRLLVASRDAELERAAARARWTAPLRRRLERRHEGGGVPDVPVTIRYAFPDDAFALGRLAALDCSEVPRGPVLLCEVDGELQAALSLLDGTVVADPFRRTGWLIDLLATRAAQLHGLEGRRRLLRRSGRQLKLRRATVA